MRTRARLAESLPGGATFRFGNVTDPASLSRDGFRGEPFDALVSCLASRTGAPRDAWAIDPLAHVRALDAARNVGVTQVVLLSASCVQKPRPAFQHAKLAFEKSLIDSGLAFSIVRPTAFFKSLSGQVERVKQGKPFLVFGDGTLTACKPIGDDDLAAKLADCLDDSSRRDRLLPIGGPGPSIQFNHAAATGRAAVRAVRMGAALSPRARRPARRDHRRVRDGGARLARVRGQGRADAHRPLLRHRIDARARPEDRPLRRRCHAVDRQREAVRLLRARATTRVCQAAPRRSSAAPTPRSERNNPAAQPRRPSQRRQPFGSVRAAWWLRETMRAPVK